MADQETYDDVCNWLADLTPATTTFVLRRTIDVTGLSGTGVVADGAVFPDMRAVTRWRGGSTGIAQTCVWDNIQHIRRIHGHDGATRIELVPYGALVKMIVAAMEAAPEGSGVVEAVARELAEYREYEDALNRAARGDKPAPARRRHDPGALMEEPDLHPKTFDPEDERRADDAHMAAMEAQMEHDAEQGEGDDRG